MTFSSFRAERSGTRSSSTTGADIGREELLPESDGDSFICNRFNTYHQSDNNYAMICYPISRGPLGSYVGTQTKLVSTGNATYGIEGF